MKELWRKTFELFRWYPILWLPYIFAQLLAGFVWRMRIQMAQHLLLGVEHLIDWMFGRRSAFGFFIETPRSEIDSRLLFGAAYLPVGLISQFLYVGLFVFALAVTAKMVESILGGKETDLRTSVKSALHRWQAMLRFTLKSYAICFAYFSLVSLPILLFPEYIGDLLSSSSVTLLSVATLPLVAIAAWLWIPGALRFLQQSAPRLVHTDTRRQGFIFAVLAIASTLAVGIIVNWILGSLQFDTQRELAVVVAAGEVLANSAIVPLFIALSLLALKMPDDPKLED